MIAVSPRLGEILTRAAQTPDIETALRKVLSEYIELKIAKLADTIQEYERKWNMTFEQFTIHCKDGTLDVDPYSWDVEQDYWAWEQAETLRQHYESLGI